MMKNGDGQKTTIKRRWSDKNGGVRADKNDKRLRRQSDKNDKSHKTQ
jgi:hypothetical protein